MAELLVTHARPVGYGQHDSERASQSDGNGAGREAEMSADVEPFEVDVEEGTVADLRERLEHTRWPDQLSDAGWDYGMERETLREMCEYWRTEYDFAGYEHRMNRFDQYTTTVDGQRIHFYHVESPEPESRPLLLSHGWPGSVVEFHEVIEPLTDPAAHGGDPDDAVDLVVPSLPGYGFSGPTSERGWDIPRIADAFAELMARLGYENFLAQGGDWGSLITVNLGASYPERVEAITAALETRFGGRPGVPNYFGHQRFGSYRSITHEVGLAILREDWDGAVMAYLGNPSPHEPASSRAARDFVAETHDWEGALDAFPNRLRYERAMLHALQDSGGQTPADYREALETFPDNLRRLFVNAAQSYVFNRIVSRRLEAGLPFHEPVAGDVVVFADEDAPAEFPVPDVDRAQRVSASQTAIMARHCERDRAFVTAPLVGTETELSGGQPGEIERAVLDELDIEPGDFDLPEPYFSTGTRRAILVRVDPTIEDEPLTFEFGLPKGSYATVFLREYLKVSPLEM